MRIKRSVSLPPEGDERIQKVADEMFGGKYSMAVDFLTRLGAEKAKSEGWGGKQADGLRELAGKKRKAEAHA